MPVTGINRRAILVKIKKEVVQAPGRTTSFFIHLMSFSPKTSPQTPTDKATQQQPTFTQGLGLLSEVFCLASKVSQLRFLMLFLGRREQDIVQNQAIPG